MSTRVRATLDGARRRSWLRWMSRLRWRRWPRWTSWLLFASWLLVACGGEEVHAVEGQRALPSCVPEARPVSFARAPSGAREVEPSWLARHRCEVRVVDVRSREELEEVGQIEGAEWVPLEELEAHAARWASEEPVVLVDRSGRRATAAALRLEALGIHAVASLTGGMRAWLADALPVVSVLARPEASPLRASVLEAPRVGDPVRAQLEDSERIVWVSVASLLGAGTEHCIDGRAGGPVVGTPGGDAGELTLALAALERTTQREVSEPEVSALVARYARSFGRFYLHTDEASLARLDRSLAADAGLRTARGEGEIAWLVRHPPVELEEELAQRLAQPEHVGCGHLRLLLEHPEEYGVRRALAETVLRETHRLRFRHPELVDFEVLAGEHEERAVVQVFLDRAVHAHSRVPTFPHREGDEVAFFVSHPEVSAFLRGELGSFLFEQRETLGDVGGGRRRRRLTREAFDHELAALAERQVRATLRHLARELPAYEVHMRAAAGSDEEAHPLVSGPVASLSCRTY